MSPSAKFVIASVLLGLCTVEAEPPKLNPLPRDHFQRGTQGEITLSGEHLLSAREVLIDGAPGVSAKVIPAGADLLKIESSSGGVTSVVAPEDKTLRVQLSIDADAALTERELRIATAEGVSNPLSFKISALPEIDSTSGNQTRESAQDIIFPGAVSGVISSAAESDFYRFKADKGERLVFDLHASRIGSPMDSSMVILNEAGGEVARSEDAVGLDSVIDFTVPEAGHYTVQIRDFRFQGGGNYRYRLIAGALPYISSSFPFGGKRGETLEVQLKGANLQGAEKVQLRLEADSPLGKQEIRAATSRGFSNSFPLDVSDLPQFIEHEPNSALDQADFISLPVALNGRMDADRDYDAFKFSIDKSQRFVFEVNAWRYGSPLDALLTLTDARGNILQRNDDAEGADARIDYTFAEAGDYFLLIEDLLGRGGDDFAYRISAASPDPDFTLTLLPDTPRVRRGDRIPIRCEVTRANGFNEPVKIWAENLPPGVYAEPLIIPTNAPAAGWIIINATAKAPLGAHPLKVVGSALSTGASVRQGRPLAGDKPAQSAYLTVLEPAPFSVRSATLMAVLEQNQSGNIEVIAERMNGFNGEIKITPEGFSTGRDPVTRSFEFMPLVLKPNETRGILSLKARLDSEIVVRPLFLRAESTVDGKTVVTYSAPVPVTTSQIPFVLSTTLKRIGVTALPTDSGSAAAEGVFMVKAERRAGFTGEIELKLEGVPEGITTTVEKISVGGAEITVKLVASEKAPAGKEFPLTITGTAVHNDRTYRFQPAVVTLAVAAPEADADEKEATLANAQ